MWHRHFALEFAHLHAFPASPKRMLVRQHKWCRNGTICSFLPPSKTIGPPHASPHKTSDKTTLRTPLVPYLTQAHVDITYSGQLAWRPTIKSYWHSGCGVWNSELHRRLWNDSIKRSVADFQLCFVVWIKPVIWGLEARVVSPLALILELGTCTGSCGSVSWLGLGSTACWSGIKVGLCVCLCVTKSGMPHRPWLSQLRVLAGLLSCVRPVFVFSWLCCVFYS